MLHKSNSTGNDCFDTNLVLKFWNFKRIVNRFAHKLAIKIYIDISRKEFYWCITDFIESKAFSGVRILKILNLNFLFVLVSESLFYQWSNFWDVRAEEPYQELATVTGSRPGWCFREGVVVWEKSAKFLDIKFMFLWKICYILADALLKVNFFDTLAIVRGRGIIMWI